MAPSTTSERDLAEVGTEQEEQPLLRTGQADGADRKDNHQDEEQRHQELRRTLDALLHATHDHKVGQHKETGCPDDWEHRLLQEGGEGGAEVRCSLSGEAVGARLDDELQCPACHHGVVAQDEKACQHAEESHPTPGSTRCKDAVGSCRVGTRAASDEELGNHDRHAHEQHAEQVDEDKRRSTMLSCLVRETPDVAQSDGRTGRGEDDADAASEVYAV